MKLLVLTMTLFCSLILNASAKKDFPVGKVEKIRGKISVLQPHTLQAVFLKKGDFVYEDSSVLSSKKSFAKIKLINDSYITIGPKSKIIVNLVKKQGATVVGLLKGALRASVKKKGDKHFFIKTRTAALGVRGTDFLTTFNYESKKTSLLTYNGSVAIKKVSKKIIIDNESTTKEKEHVVTKIKKLLNEKPVFANVGEFTNVGVTNEEPEAVVKVNVQQVARLKIDETLGADTKVVSDEIVKKEMKAIVEEIKLVQKKSKVKIAENKLTDGGFVDTGMGLYIPPAKKGKVVGKITSNGTYVPPKGLKLDAHKGFVALNEKSEDMAEELNETLADQVVPEPENPAYKRYFDSE